VRTDLQDVLLDTYDRGARRFGERGPKVEVLTQWTRQVRRRRRARAVKIAVAVVPSIAVLAIGVVYGTGVLSDRVAPLGPAASPAVSTHVATTPYPLPAIPRAEIGGYEGWWGYTYEGPVPSPAAEHPATILVNTWTGEVVEAFERADDGTPRQVPEGLVPSVAVDSTWPQQSIVVLDGVTLEVVDHFPVDREGYVLLPPGPVAPGWTELRGAAKDPYTRIGIAAGVEHLRTEVSESDQVRSTYRHELGAWFDVLSARNAPGDSDAWLAQDGFDRLTGHTTAASSSSGSDGQIVVRAVQGTCRLEATISPPAEAAMGAQIPDAYIDYVADVLLPATAAHDCP